MTTQKQSWPSFVSIISIFSIVLYCAGFLRIELELDEQKKRISTLENVAKTNPPSDSADIITFFKNVLANDLHRNRRQVVSANNATDDKPTEDETLKVSKRLAAELRMKLCPSKADACSLSPPGPPGPPGTRGEKGARGRRGQKGKSGNKGDRGIMGSPGKSGKQGIMGPVGPQGEDGTKGQKGDIGPAGVPGAKGEPAESISAPVVAVSPAKLTVNEGGTASFQCSVSGNPEPTLKWSKKGSQTELSQSGTLLLTKVTGSDSSVYKCSASNILGQAEALVRLVVNVRPRVSLQPGPRYATEGSAFRFPTCHVTGHPAPMVTWRKSSGQLPQERVRLNNGALQILHVRKSDSDAYFCSAANFLGTVEKKTLLVVVSLPRFIVTPPAKRIARLGDALTLNCSATGDPQPVISWKKQRGQLPGGRSQENNGSLVITNLKRGDTGIYICVATSASVFHVETVTFLEVKGLDGLDASYILGDLDSKYLDKLKAYLNPVLLSSARSKFIRCWHAKIDGWAAATFHSNCDGKGPTVTLIKVDSYIFGGYTDVSWSSPSSAVYGSSNKSFIYSLYNINGYAPVKIQIKSGRYSSAIYRYYRYGPTFGYGHDIHIANNAASSQRSYTYCDQTYPLPPGYSSSGSSCTFYAGSYSFTPTDVEVFYKTTT